MERAYDDWKYGGISRAPCIEARYAGSAGNERYLVQVDVQYVPHALGGTAWDTGQSEKLARGVVERIAAATAGLGGAVIEQRVRTPDDLEHVEGYPEGQEYHAELALDQILWMRPVPQLAHYRTPVKGLYLCGPSMHPGGGIAGAAGANAASVLLRDLN